LPSDLLQTARTLAPRISALAEETERGRRLPAELVATFADAGFFLKAVAVCKQILKLTPRRIDAQVMLADSYAALKLVEDALSAYQEAAD